MAIRHVLAFVALGSWASTGVAQLAAPTTPEPNPERVQQLERKLEAAMQYIQGLRSELDALKSGAAGAAQPSAAGPQPGQAPPTPQTSEDVRAASRNVVPQPGQAPPTPQTAATQAPAPAPEEARQAGNVAPDPEPGPSPEQERPVFTPAFLRQANAVLIPRNRIEFDPRFQYGFNDTNVLAVAGLDLIETVFVGTIEVEKRRRHFFSGILGTRYGITDRFQVSASFPYRYEIEQLTIPPQVQRLPDPFEAQETSGGGIGDIEAGLSYHILQEKGWRPDLIAGLSVKTNTGQGPFDNADGDTVTGTGFWGIQPQLTFVKVTDPGILFASASYLYHIEDSLSGIGDVDPGDVLQLSAGYGYALNPYLSLTTRFQFSWADELSVEGQDVAGTDLYATTLSLGLTYGLTRHAAIDTTLDIGLSEDASDFRLSVGIPFQFDMPKWDRLFRSRTTPNAPTAP